MKIAGWLLLLFWPMVVLSAECRDPGVRVTADQRDDGVHILAQSDNLLDYVITLDAKLENMIPSVPLPLTMEVRGKKEVELVVLRVREAQLPKTYHYTYGWRYGGRGGTPDRVPYQLPYLPGEHHRLMQGYLGDFSHQAGSQSEYAYDFAMPVGTTVCAARDGVVVGVRQDSDVSGRTPAFGNCGNYVIIRHSDGTCAEYFHLKQNGVLVPLGATVKAGQPIALSGMTGFTSAPHLHFAVFRALDGYKRETLPVFMQTKDGLRARLVEGQTY
ncbi:MAG TPA: M23 family metallopeptidase [Opitutaceae bacterium]|nr:M23 family metallopeptidase [Opitutaceae bacterium]